MKFFLFLFMFFLTIQTSFAALPGKMNLKNGYQMYTLSTKTPELWTEQKKYFFHNAELQLTEDEITQLKQKVAIEERVEKSINTEYLKNYLEKEIAPQVNKEAGKATLSLKDNRVFIDGNIQEGNILNIPLSVQIIERALTDKVDEITLAVNVIQPQLNIDKNVSLLGIQEVVAIGESNFHGSTEGRIHNIKTGLKRFEGLIVKPHEEFSFNKYLGAVDESTGYKKELVIKGDETLPEWGGGICQVSSTLYRSVMLSGLPIVERSNHSYSVDYYSPSGSDATIYPGSHDFRFINDSDYSMAIHSYIVDTKLYFVLLGHPSQQHPVDLFGPYITNTIPAPPTRYIPSKNLPNGQTFLMSLPHNGYTATWFRAVADRTEKYVSVYEARPKVFKVGGLTEIKIGNL